MNHKVLLIIRDGWGYSKATKGNAVKLANLKNDDTLVAVQKIQAETSVGAVPEENVQRIQAESSADEVPEESES